MEKSTSKTSDTLQVQIQLLIKVSQVLFRFLSLPSEKEKGHKEVGDKTEESKASKMEETIETSLSSELKLKKESRKPPQYKKKVRSKTIMNRKLSKAQKLKIHLKKMNNLLKDESSEDDKKDTEGEVETPKKSPQIIILNVKEGSRYSKNFSLNVAQYLSAINSRELTTKDRYRSVFLFRETNNQDFDHFNTFQKLVSKFKNPLIIKHVKAIGYERMKGTKACIKLKI